MCNCEYGQLSTQTTPSTLRTQSLAIALFQLADENFTFSVATKLYSIFGYNSGK